MPENSLNGKVQDFFRRAGKFYEDLEDFFSAKGTIENRRQREELLTDRYQKLNEEAKELFGKSFEQVRLLVEHVKRQDLEIADAKDQNEKLVRMLQGAKKEILSLREEVEKLSAPPNGYGVFSSVNEDGTVNIYIGGRKMKVNVSPSVKADDLHKGQEVILNEAFNVIAAAKFETRGEVVTVKSRLDDGRVQIVLRHDEEQIVEVGDTLLGVSLKEGEHLLFDSRSGFVLEKLPKAETNDLLLEELPAGISYKRIGGMDAQIEMLKDAIELPYLFAGIFKEHQLRPPKGILLYGPPGCGKTLLGKAVAVELAARATEIAGKEVKAYFFNIKGPELLNKFVGETERKIREIFSRARELAKEGHLVVMFWDEIESMLRTRGMGISSDVESTIVPQFLSEIDGVEELRNVIVIGATNRQDLVDPAVLRPGRFDVKIQIERPAPAAAVDILLKYITTDLPLDPGFFSRGKEYDTPNRLRTLYPESWAKVNEAMQPFFSRHPGLRDSLGKRHDTQNEMEIEWERWNLGSTENLCLYYAARVVEDVFIETSGKQEWKDRQGRIVPFHDTRLLKVTLAGGQEETLYVRDFISGALLENIVNRAKKIAIKRLIAGAPKGLVTGDFHLAAQEETAEMEDLPNTSDPNAWGKIQGRFKDRIVNLQTIRSEVVVPTRKVKTVTVGHYL